MEKWWNALKQIGILLFGRESTSEMWAVAVVCIFAVFLVYEKISAGFHGKGRRSFLTLIPGVILLALTAAAVRLYVSGGSGVQLLAVLSVFFVVVVPLTRAVEKTSYFNAFFVWAACALVMGAILFVEPGIVRSFQRGIEKGTLMNDRRSGERNLIRQAGE